MKNGHPTEPVRPRRRTAAAAFVRIGGIDPVLSWERDRPRTTRRCPRNTHPTAFPVRAAISAPTTAKRQYRRAARAGSGPCPRQPNTIPKASLITSDADISTMLTAAIVHATNDRRSCDASALVTCGSTCMTASSSRSRRSREGGRPAARRREPHLAAGCRHPRPFRMLAGSNRSLAPRPTVRSSSREGAHDDDDPGGNGFQLGGGPRGRRCRSARPRSRRRAARAARAIGWRRASGRRSRSVARSRPLPRGR